VHIRHDTKCSLNRIGAIYEGHTVRQIGPELLSEGGQQFISKAVRNARNFREINKCPLNRYPMRNSRYGQSLSDARYCGFRETVRRRIFPTQYFLLRHPAHAMRPFSVATPQFRCYLGRDLVERGHDPVAWQNRAQQRPVPWRRRSHLDGITFLDIYC
jgi:hypothetical protein